MTNNAIARRLVLGSLTDREREVLSLRTERTVEHRVRGVLMKLDLPESEEPTGVCSR
jgi:hypothetical protein